MARIRTIKPEFFKHEDLFDLEKETGLPIRVAFAGLFTVCDRDGRFKWAPRAIKSDVLPHDTIDFSRVLNALLTRGLIVKYNHHGSEYGCIPTFKKHQVINNRERHSEIPSHDDENSIILNTSTRGPRDDNASTELFGKDQGEGKGKEGKGKEGKESVMTTKNFDFDSLYQKYPLKEGKQLGLERLKKIIKTDEDYQLFSKAIDKYIQVLQKKGTDPQYIKQFSTFVGTSKSQPWLDFTQDDVGTSQIQNVGKTMSAQLPRSHGNLRAMEEALKMVDEEEGFL